MGTSKRLLACMVTLLLVLSSGFALACGGGGGSSGGSDFSKRFSSDGGGGGSPEGFTGFEPPGAIASGTRDTGPAAPDKYGETGDFGISHQTWATIYNGLYNGAKVADVAGTISSFFIPGAGTYKAVKIINTIGKGYAVTQDKEKQDFIGKIISGIGKGMSNFGTPGPSGTPGSVRTGTQRAPASQASQWGRRW